MQLLWYFFKYCINYWWYIVWSVVTGDFQESQRLMTPVSLALVLWLLSKFPWHHAPRITVWIGRTLFIHARIWSVRYDCCDLFSLILVSLYHIIPDLLKCSHQSERGPYEVNPDGGGRYQWWNVVAVLPSCTLKMHCTLILRTAFQNSRARSTVDQKCNV